ncbi:MAG TPA: hypothetical protein VLC46_16225 [Thermoanaerobaculia bacterium]|jgi:hypothetical protein|nr:hypothetical protein [Thermoanaerobaculia bacterium]
MAVRGEEVAGSIEAHVRDAMEKLVGEIRSSIEDVREVVDSQLKAALQSVQADVNAVSFLPHIQKSIGELEESIAAAHPPPVVSASAGSDASRVKKAVQAVEHGKSQVDILNALLEQCLAFGSRAAMLILRGETFSGWKGVGFSAAGGNDEMVKRFNAAPGLIPELDKVLRLEQVVTWDGANLSTRLGVAASSYAILVPMVIKDKVAAAVYVDATEQDAARLDPASIELLVFATGLLIDTLAIRKKTPSPSLNDPESAMAPPHAPASPVPVTPPRPAAPAPAPPPRPTVSTPPLPPPPRPVAPPPVRPTPPVSDKSPDATVAVSADQLREMMAPGTAQPAFTMPETDFSAPASAKPATPTFMTTAAIPAVEPPRPAPPPPPPPPPAPSPVQEREERPSTQYIPPPNLSRGGTPASGGSGDDMKKHDEARRFARLLVSEIKLYNEPKVDAGRKNKDLYERLKEDIDRSRQMYDERISDDVRKTSNYFYDELVRILADGDAGALGL